MGETEEEGDGLGGDMVGGETVGGGGGGGSSLTSPVDVSVNKSTGIL